MTAEELALAVLDSVPPVVRAELRLAGSKAGVYVRLRRVNEELIALEVIRGGTGERLDIAADPQAAADLLVDYSRNAWVSETLWRELRLETRWYWEASGYAFDSTLFPGDA